jgi:hypothetical protein
MIFIRLVHFRSIAMTEKQTLPENVGVINPYALSEVMLRKKINWEKVDVRQTLQDALGQPYEDLFDPIHDSPLYTGLHLNRETMAMEQAPVAEVQVAYTLEGGAAPTHSDADKPISDEELALEEFGTQQVLAGVAATSVWVDPGIFFSEACETCDPVQGALGDCYFIAALSSVAWARTYSIAHRTRATGIGQQSFVDMVEFFNNGNVSRVEVTELLPLNSPGNSFIYARSSEAGEIWPAIYEKAYAKWRTGDTGDKPNYAPIAGGDPVRAAAQLTGLKPYYHWNAGLSADEIWQKVRQNSLSRKTFNPMVAWTYPSGQASPDNVNYNNAHLAANHAYSILGWDYQSAKKYIVLRNPWGCYESTLSGNFTWLAYDTPYYGGPGWWRPVHMATADGIFALEAADFKKYFAGFGFVK